MHQNLSRTEDDFFDGFIVNECNIQANCVPLSEIEERKSLFINKP